MIHRTINWKVLAVSLGAAVVLAGGLYLLHGWQLSRLASGLLAIAQKREEQEKWHEAAAYFDRYLRVHRMDAGSRARLAEVYAKGAASPEERTRAVELHYRALAADPAADEAV